MKEKTQQKIDVKKMVDSLAQKANVALEEFMKLDQKQVDAIVHAMTIAGNNAHFDLAKLAREETGRGVLEDKVIKNIFATETIWHNIKNLKTVGVIEVNEMEGYEMIAEPFGVVAGVTPVTNPTSTTMFKSLICAKTRNPVIFGFHPSAQECSKAAAIIMRDAAIKAGAPKDCIQWIEYPSVEATNELMNHTGIALILATGGSGMVQAAYSAGKPALGVGPGNVPCYIEKTADLEQACTDLMMSKTFDNGMICASEQAVIVDKEISGAFEKYMKSYNCHFLSEDEIKKVTAFAFNSDTGALNSAIVGQSAAWIAEKSGFSVHQDTKILIAKLPAVGKEYPISKEKLSPILAYYVSDNHKQGFMFARQMLELGGLGHSAVIHSKDSKIITQYGIEMQVGRVIANCPSSQGAIGDIYNTLTPSLTLGCGSFGRNSTTNNVSAVNLINIKRIAHRRNNMQWFKVPPKIYFEKGSVQYLEKMPKVSRVFVVTDETMMKMGYVDRALYYLEKRKNHCSVQVFYDVEPDPSLETIQRGVKAMESFQPDTIIALGGGSPIDAAKCMWLFYEHPDSSFEGMTLKFMDIRKRAYAFSELGNRAQMVAIPTTSGTGSEVTSFSVITDKNKNIKFPLADYELTPDVAIIDSQFVMSLPASVTADTGMDVLTHAIEAYVSDMANDYTNGLAMKAIQLVFKYLPTAYANGSDEKAREKMHNASCIAGMAFTNAFLGLNHSMAHKLGGEYNIPHGRANALLLPHIIEYNATKPVKFATFPKYGRFIADRRYSEIAHVLGLPARTTEEGVASLVDAVRKLNKSMNIPETIKDCGVNEKVFLDNLHVLSENAHGDQCTPANPRYPLISEIETLYKKAYYGNLDK